MNLWRRMMLVALAGAGSVFAETAGQENEIDQPPHNYRQRAPQDRFTRLKAALESGEIALERGREKAFVLGLLKALEVPATSQKLVFSTTSLTMRLNSA